MRLQDEEDALRRDRADLREARGRASADQGASLALARQLQVFAQEIYQSPACIYS